MKTFQRLAPGVLWANLVSQIIIVVTGGLVRVTGSGLGCSSWPNCEPGQFTPVFHEATPYHAFIEFGNRTITVVLLVFAALVVLGLYFDKSLSQELRYYSLWPLIGVVAQALVGAIVVLLSLHPATVGIHLLISMWLIWVSVGLLLRFRTEKATGTAALPGRMDWQVSALTWLMSVVIFLGMIVTGAGPHSGDENAPYRFALDPLLMSRIHAAAVWLFIAVLLIVVIRTRRGFYPGLGTPVTLLLVITLSQGAIGYVQTFTGLPIVLVNLHLLGAAVLTAATAWVVTSARLQHRVNQAAEERVGASRS